MGHKGRVEIKKKEKNSETKSWFLKKGKVDNLAVYIRNKKKRHKLSISGIKKVIYYRILKIYIDNKEYFEQFSDNKFDNYEEVNPLKDTNH